MAEVPMWVAMVGWFIAFGVGLGMGLLFWPLAKTIEVKSREWE